MNHRRKKLPIVLEPREAGSLLKQPNKRYLTGLRDKAILFLMLDVGLRVSEVANLKPSDVNLTEGKLRVINGKGGVDRELFLSDFIIYLLREWKERKPKSTEYFFTTLKDKKEGKFTCKPGKRLAVRNIQFMVKKYAKKAGIDKIISPHTLRHSFATEYYRQTKDLETLRMVLGHSSIMTTQIYVTLANIDVENGMKSFKGFEG